MGSWQQIAVLVTAIILLILMFPKVNERLKKSPKGTADDWRLVMLLLGGVALFVYILIKLV